MTVNPQTGVGLFVKFVGLSLGCAAVTIAIGYIPTKNIAGVDGVYAMLAGVAISWISSCVGAIPVAYRLSSDQAGNAANAILTATMVRFMVVLMLVAAMVFSGIVDRNVLVLWVGISYLLMLAIDTLFAIAVMKRQSGNGNG